MSRALVHARRLGLGLVAAVLASAGALVVQPLTAAAATCSTVDVVVARGTAEPGRLGIVVGDPVYGALQASLAGRSTTSYPVNYPATLDPASVGLGNTDLVRNLTAQASACPDQRFILVGYSQGANVVDNSIGISSQGALVGGPITATLPASIAPRVAAVLLFGNPIRALGRSVTGTYQDRTLDLCAAGDPVCGGGTNFLAHLSYGQKAGQAAAFAAARV
jgi:cutinase